MKNKKTKKQNTNKIFLIYLLLPFLSFSIFNIIHAETTKISGNEKTVISLPTIVCGQCVTKIEKALNEVDGVSDYKVDLDNKNVTITYDNSVTSLEKLENAITKAGYDANDKIADTEVYDRLPGCCKAR